MKKLLLLCTLAFISFFVKAQTDPQFIYCEIVGTSKMMSNKVTIEIDYGQATSFFANNRLRGEDGKPMVFNSMVDAMNMLGNDGWEFAQAYVVTVGQQNVYHWLLKKNVAKLSEEEKKELLSTYKTTK